MDAREALAVLGLRSPADMVDVRAAYRRLVRRHHPDVSGEPSARAARLTEAYAVLQRAARQRGDGTVVVADPPPGRSPAPPPPPARERAAYQQAAIAELAGGDTIVFHAPAAEAFAALFEAAGRIGHIAYFDRQLGILETIVRFEGGPSCSFLVTLQGRSYGTEAFCTLESIEAAPTPPIAIVVETLLQELAAGRSAGPTTPA